MISNIFKPGDIVRCVDARGNPGIEDGGVYEVAFFEQDFLSDTVRLKECGPRRYFTYRFVWDEVTLAKKILDSYE
jgi:hypothetical protein